MEDMIFGVVMLCVGVLIGNWQGDQATLRDCATESAARMVGGGTITCEVINKAERPT